VLGLESIAQSKVAEEHVLVAIEEHVVGLDVPVSEINQSTNQSRADVSLVRSSRSHALTGAREREHVQVNDVALVHVLESEHQLRKDSLRLRHRQHSVGIESDVVVEVASSSELHHEEQALVDLDSIVELDDMRVRESRHRVSLSESELSVGVRGVELLDDHWLASRLADGNVDDAVVSAVELLSELVSMSAELASDGARSLGHSRRSRRSRSELDGRRRDHFDDFSSCCCWSLLVVVDCRQAVIDRSRVGVRSR